LKGGLVKKGGIWKRREWRRRRQFKKGQEILISVGTHSVVNPWS
jgi:hypothetical protein